MYKYLKTYTILNYIDALLTFIILSNINVVGLQETNKIYVYVFSFIGIFFGLFLIKTIGILIFWFLYKSMMSEIKNTIDEKFKEISIKYHIRITRENLITFVNGACIFLNLVYILIVLNNLYWLYQNFK